MHIYDLSFSFLWVELDNIKIINSRLGIIKIHTNMDLI